MPSPERAAAATCCTATQTDAAEAFASRASLARINTLRRAGLGAAAAGVATGGVNKVATGGLAPASRTLAHTLLDAFLANAATSAGSDADIDAACDETQAPVEMFESAAAGPDPERGRVLPAGDSTVPRSAQTVDVGVLRGATVATLADQTAVAPSRHTSRPRRPASASSTISSSPQRRPLSARAALACQALAQPGVAQGCSERDVLQRFVRMRPAVPAHTPTARDREQDHASSETSTDCQRRTPESGVPVAHVRACLTLPASAAPWLQATAHAIERAPVMQAPMLLLLISALREHHAECCAALTREERRKCTLQESVQRHLELQYGALERSPRMVTRAAVLVASVLVHAAELADVRLFGVALGVLVDS